VQELLAARGAWPAIWCDDNEEESDEEEEGGSKGHSLVLEWSGYYSLQELGPPLNAAAANGHTEVCGALLKKGMHIKLVH
jgi:hypothetical protein